MAEEIFNPNDALALQTEWVTLSNGKRLCVWESDTAAMFQVTDRCTIQAGPHTGRLNRAEAAIWEIILSCFDSDKPNRRPIWQEEDVLKLYRLPSRDSAKILAAIGRVNGTDPETIETLANFTEAPTAGISET